MKLPKSKYRNVYPFISGGKYFFWRGRICCNYRTKMRLFKVERKEDLAKIEREAAKWVDIQLIRLGKDPINIYKKVI